MDTTDDDAVLVQRTPGAAQHLWANPPIYEDSLTHYSPIHEAAKAASVRRLLIVGGAGTLYVAHGLLTPESGKVPQALLPGLRALAECYLNTLTRENGVAWVFLSPAGVPGNADRTARVRTGKYRDGKADLIVDAVGKSSISVEDSAKAMVDELETAAHHKERCII